MPVLNTPQQLNQWVKQAKADHKYVLHPYRSHTVHAHTQPQSIALLIGPEGGLSEPEVDLAQTQGFAPMVLGPRILRAETAPLAALALLQHQYGDF